MLKFKRKRLFWSSSRQSMAKKRRIINKPAIKPKTVFQVKNPFAIATAFRAAKSPLNTIKRSLQNLPTTKDGMILDILMRATPAAVNNGVEGKGTNVYSSAKSRTFRSLPSSFFPINSMSSFFCALMYFSDRIGIYKLRIYRPSVEPATPITMTYQMSSPYRI
jgi:hypothetical protein